MWTPKEDFYRAGWVQEQEAITTEQNSEPEPQQPDREGWWGAEAGAERLQEADGRGDGAARGLRGPAEGGGRGRGGAAARASRRHAAAPPPLAPRASPRLARPRPAPPPLARSLLPALPAAPAGPASPRSLMNIERPLLYFPSSIAEAEARHIVRRRRRPRRLVPESRSAAARGAPGWGRSRWEGLAGRRRARARARRAGARGGEAAGGWRQPGGRGGGAVCGRGGVKGDGAAAPGRARAGEGGGRGCSLFPFLRGSWRGWGVRLRGGPSGRSSGIPPRLRTPRRPLLGAEAGLRCGPWPPGAGAPSSAAPLGGKRWGMRGFFLRLPPPRHRGGGVEALCANSPLGPRDAGVGVRGWRRCSATGFLVGCGETPPG